MRHGRWRAPLVLGWVCATACYSGRQDWNPGPATLGPGADGGDGDDDGRVPDDASLCEGEPSLANALTWRLTEQQYDNTVRDLLGISDASGGTLAAGDGRIGVFSNNTDAAVSLTSVEQYGLLAREITQTAMADLEALVPCDPAQGDEACAADFIAEFGARALRRPLSAQTHEVYLDLYRAGEAESFEAGIRMVIEALLQSPRFLYRVEEGTPMEGAPQVHVLDDYELASRLSYFLLDSMPDAALFESAAAGELSTREGLRAQAERLLSRPEAADALSRFHSQWLGLEHTLAASKDAPQWNDSLARDSLDEVRRLLTATIIEGEDPTLANLLTTRTSHASSALAEVVYGQPGAGSEDGSVAFELPAHHSGLLLRSAFLAAHSHAERQSPVLSGFILRTRLLCQPLLDPPEEADTTPPVPDPNSSTREQYMVMLDDPNCFGCHTMMNPLGFSMLNYDAIGRFQTMEGQHVVDASGSLVGTDVDGPFDNAVELMEQLSRSEDVADCVAAQWFDFAVGHPPRPDDECGLAHAREQFRDSGYDLRALIVAIVETDTFRYRTAGEG